jgi:hypothetical protein
VKWMGKLLENVSSIRFWILVVVSVYFVYALYYALYGLQWSIGLTHDSFVYNSVIQDPLWWQILYYGSEGVTGTLGIILRAFASGFAFYAAFLYWRKKDAAMPAVRVNACRALLLEAAFFLTLLLSIIAAFAYNLTSLNLFYFGHTPGLILLFGTAIPCLAIVLVVPPLLLKLRAKIKQQAPKPEIAKWAGLTGLGYLFVVFWFSYSMLWAACMVPYPRSGQQYGLSFLFEPSNFLSFAVTVFGLLAIAIAALVAALPAIKKQTSQVNLTLVGAVMVAFGSYFLFNTIYYYATGTYQAHPSVWYEVIGPLHNPNLWSLAFIFLGAPLIILGRKCSL